MVTTATSGTSAIQTQLNAKAPSTAPTFATSITGSYLTASEILITDASKNIVSAPVATYPSLTELTYVKGVTSAIQTQLNAKQATISFGTGVETALGVNAGSAGAFVVNGGALGTPSSGTLTNATGLPISTGVSGLGTGVATFLATPSSANLASALTDETGTGLVVFNNSPTFVDDITVGGAGVASGIVKLSGTTSGTVSLSVAETAGTWTMKLPASAGTSGYVLSTDGAGVTSWIAAGAGDMILASRGATTGAASGYVRNSSDI